MIRKKIPWNELVVFTRQLSASIEMNLPLHEAVRTEINSTPRALRKVLNSVANELENGMAFSTAISEHRKTFPDYYVEMVRTGEQTGTLPSVLNILANMLEDSHDRKMKFRHAFHYPIVVLIVGLLSVLFHVTFIAPKYAEIYSSFDMTLPPASRFVINVSRVFIHHFPLILLFITTFFLMVFLLIRFRPQILHKIIWRIPFFGRLSQGISTADICRILQPLLVAGVPLPNALRLSAQSSRNTVARNALMNSCERIEQGHDFAEALGERFPASFTWMVAASEKRGELVESLDTIAKYYQDESDNALEILKQVLEPVLLVLAALIIGLVVLSIYMPLFSLPNIYPL